VLGISREKKRPAQEPREEGPEKGIKRTENEEGEGLSPEKTGKRGRFRARKYVWVLEYNTLRINAGGREGGDQTQRRGGNFVIEKRPQGDRIYSQNAGIEIQKLEEGAAVSRMEGDQKRIRP